MYRSGPFRTLKSSSRRWNRPGAISINEAVPRPKWKSSVPENSPRACVTATDGVAVGEDVRDGAGSRVGGAVDADATDGAGVDVKTGAAVGPASTSEVRIQTGEATYHVTGAPTASSAATTSPVRPRCRRAMAAQPRRQATMPTTTAMTAAVIATATRWS